ncbi:YJL034Wp-like protein [Amylocystis lapponica]|nr:YJL034Wp-like protein [Amylocystis lapponica]
MGKLVLGKLKRQVEKAKHTLSSQQSTRLKIESFEGSNDVTETLTRAKFEELNMDLFRKTMEPVEQVLKDANLKKQDINEIVLVSGLFDLYPQGPAAPEGILWNRAFQGHQPRRKVVAYSAAVRGGNLSGDETLGDVVLVNLLDGSGQPANCADPGVRGRVFLTKDKNLLGKFQLSGIPPRGVPQIEVTFELMPTVSCGASLPPTRGPRITNEKGCLTFKEIDRMVKGAEEFAAVDEAQRKRIKTLNSLSSFVFGLKSRLADQDNLGGKLEDEDKWSLLDMIKETNEWFDDNGATASVEDLEEQSH